MTIFLSENGTFKTSDMFSMSIVQNIWVHWICISLHYVLIYILHSVRTFLKLGL